MATILFDDFIKSMAVAVAETNKYLLQSQEDTSCFDESEDQPGVLKPKTLRMLLPAVDGQTNRDHNHDCVHEVPTGVLAHHNHMLMDKLSLDFHCLVDGQKDGPKGDARIALILGGLTADRRDLAKVKISFRCAEPPEGAARLNDQLLKKI